MALPSAQRNHWMITVLLSGLALGYAFLLFLPWQKAIAAQRAEVATKLDQIERSLTTAGAIQTAERERHEAQEFIAESRSLLTKSHELSACYAALSRGATLAGVKIVKFDPRPERPGNAIGESPLSLACTGSFTQVYDFVRSIEGQGQIIWVERMKLDKENPNSELVKCELNVVVFTEKAKNSG